MTVVQYKYTLPQETESEEVTLLLRKLAEARARGTALLVARGSIPMPVTRYFQYGQEQGQLYKPVPIIESPQEQSERLEYQELFSPQSLYTFRGQKRPRTYSLESAEDKSIELTRSTLQEPLLPDFLRAVPEMASDPGWTAIFEDAESTLSALDSIESTRIRYHMPTLSDAEKRRVKQAKAELEVGIRNGFTAKDMGTIYSIPPLLKSVFCTVSDLAYRSAASMGVEQDMQRDVDSFNTAIRRCPTAAVRLLQKFIRVEVAARDQTLPAAYKAQLMEEREYHQQQVAESTLQWQQFVTMQHLDE